METTNLNWLAGFLNHEQYHGVLSSHIHHGLILRIYMAFDILRLILCPHVPEP